VYACPHRSTGDSVRLNTCAISNMRVSLESGHQRAPGADVTTVGSQVNAGNTSTPVAGCNDMLLCRSDKAELCPSVTNITECNDISTRFRTKNY